jgi:hypothetical protein
VKINYGNLDDTPHCNKSGAGHWKAAFCIDMRDMPNTAEKDLCRNIPIYASIKNNLGAFLSL